MKAKIVCMLCGLHHDESGQDLIEYALMAALIAFGAVASMNALTNQIFAVFTSIGTFM